MKLEVVVIPVSDVDRAKTFYEEKAGFHLDHDNPAGGGFRVVQFTPPGSGCSISFGEGLVRMPPGASGARLQLVVEDVEGARAEFAARGLEVSEVRHVDLETGTWESGAGGDWNSFVFFDDPDGNEWTVQQAPPQR